MQWDEVEVFVCVAELGSFTRAAERLGRPKSSVSRAVAALEKRLGERLFERSSRTVRLTESGSELLREAGPLVARLSDILTERQSQRAEVRGVLRVATSYEIATANLIDVLPDLLSRHPELDVVVDIQHRLVDPVEAGYDLILYQSQAQLSDSSVVARRLYDVAFGVYASPSMIRQRGFPETPADLLSWPGVTASENQVYRFFSTETGEIVPLQFGSRIAVPVSTMRARCVEMGIGAAVLPSLFCRELVEQRRLIRVLPAYEPVPLTIYALLPSRKNIPARVNALLDAISSRFDSLTTVR
jgi:DNA-binding transcriptional LysR family regulator